VSAAAAGLAMVALGTLLLVSGPEVPSRAASRQVNPSVAAGSYVLERGDRLAENMRALGLTLSAAVEGRIDRVNERVEDYRRHLHRRRSPEGDVKRESGLPHHPQSARVFEPRPPGTRSPC
jgi:hypothetical protein